MLVKLLHHVPNFKELSKEVFDIIDRMNSDRTQIMCQTLEDGIEDWNTGTGKLENLNIKDEAAYKFIQPSIKNSVLSGIISEFNGFRTRIMIMPGRHSYSVHKDITPRIHIPIATNSQSWMIWPFENNCYRLAEGFAYWTDTTKNHTFINGDLNKRIHLVICVNE